MDRELLVQNIEQYCSKKGVKPTNACRNSGVGASFLTDIKRGQTPSVAKVQLLAQYLGCTVSDLLGERAVSESGTVRRRRAAAPAGLPQGPWRRSARSWTRRLSLTRHRWMERKRIELPSHDRAFVSDDSSRVLRRHRTHRIRCES